MVYPSFSEGYGSTERTRTDPEWDDEDEDDEYEEDDEIRAGLADRPWTMLGDYLLDAR